jgi:uncharacterized protein (TIGR03086 family)
MHGIVANHRRACEGFSTIVVQGGGSWANPSPCSEWDAEALVEHVIGFHDVLLLGPTRTKPTRPKGDPVARWSMTVSALDSAVETVASGTEAGRSGAVEVRLDRLLPMLTTDVVVHTWDLARAIDVDPQLDHLLCELTLQAARSRDEQLRASGLFGAAVPVPAEADACTRLVAFFGRNPEWVA